MFRRAVLLITLLSCTSEDRGGIVSLVPSADEIIAHIGAKDRLTGVSTYSKLKGSKPVVGDLINPDYERILSIKPEVVIITLPMQKEVKKRLESLGLKTHDFSPESVEELTREIVNLGVITGKEKEAKALADSIKKLVSEIKPLGNFTFYVEVSPKPVFVAGGNTYISDIVERFGGKNVFSDRNGYFPVSTEEIVKKSPQVALVPHEVGKRLGMGVCVVVLQPDHLSPGLSVFGLVALLEEKLPDCLKISR